MKMPNVKGSEIISVLQYDVCPVTRVTDAYFQFQHSMYINPVSKSATHVGWAWKTSTVGGGLLR